MNVLSFFLNLDFVSALLSIVSFSRLSSSLRVFLPYSKPFSVPKDELTPFYDWRMLGDLLDLPCLDFFDLESVGAEELGIVHWTGFSIIPLASRVSSTILHCLAFIYASWETSISNYVFISDTGHKSLVSVSLVAYY